jgi:hypothetical protein
MLILALSACEPEAPPAYDADDLAAEIASYTDWGQVADWEGVRPSCDGAHGDYVQIWLNDVALADVEDEHDTFSEGAVLVKEGYQDAGVTKKGLDAMRKVADYDPAAGDWFWGHYGEEGEPIATGHVSGCVGCHESGGDYVRFLGSEVVTSLGECP